MHTVDTVKSILLDKGFMELKEGEAWTAEAGNYFVIRGGSSVIAFKRGKAPEGFTVVASHTDTPALKITGLNERGGLYASVPVEKYGGSILYSWLDRPLSIAGRLVVKTESAMSVKLVNVDRDLISIPSIAIHQNRGVNDGYKLNPAVDMLPLLSLAGEGGDLKKLLAEVALVNASDIISSDLYVYNRDGGHFFGIDGEFVLSPRLDNLASVFSSLTAFVEAPARDDTVEVLAAFDNEEVGNATKQGANSTFLKSVLTKIAGGDEALYSMLDNSFMVSLDNAHARHPNHPELSNPQAAPILGGGVAVKYHANQFYTTDAVSDAAIRFIAEKAGVTLQSFATRADMLSGSTLGSVATTRLGICSVDLGIPQLAMHSSTETVAVADIDSAVELIRAVYSSKVSRNGAEIKIC